MAKRKPKRYKKSDLISKIKSHLRKRYGVPEEIIDYIDFESIIKEGMTMNEAYEALMRAEPRLKPYLSKRKKIKDIETKIEEDLYKQAKLLDDVVREAEEGDKQAKSIILDLLKKAIVEGDENAIEIIKTAYDLTPGEFAKELISRGVISEEDYRKLIEQIKKPPIAPKPHEEYEKLVQEISKELRDFHNLIDHITYPELKKIGFNTLHKKLAKIKAKLSELESLKSEIPKKAPDIEKLKSNIERFLSFHTEYLHALEKLISVYKAYLLGAGAKDVDVDKCLSDDFNDIKSVAKDIANGKITQEIGIQAVQKIAETVAKKFIKPAPPIKTEELRKVIGESLERGIAQVVSQVIADELRDMIINEIRKALKMTVGEFVTPEEIIAEDIKKALKLGAKVCVPPGSFTEKIAKKVIPKGFYEPFVQACLTHGAPSNILCPICEVPLKKYENYYCCPKCHRLYKKENKTLYACY